MLPIGPLMVEHRLIERMVALLEAHRKSVGETNRPDPDFILSAADFFQIYADRCHHGKEEDILFADLEKKDLADEHRRTLEELKAEHVLARERVLSLRVARKRYVEGDPGAAGDIHEILGLLVDLYPGHIEKEDRHFFFPAMEYFRKKEQLEMLDRFWEFDEHLIHRVFRDVVQTYEDRE